MSAFLTNPWTIGIAGGVLSGLIVTLVTRYIFSKRENREYLQKVLSANKEVLYAIRPSISEGCLPTREVVMSLISSTSRKYGVEEKDMYSIELVSDDLIKEVMDSSFISAKIKTEYCNHLTQLRKTTEIVETIPLSLEQVESMANYRRRMLNLMSLMLGTTAALMTLLVAFLQFKRFDSIPSELLKLTLPALLAMFSSVFVAYLMLLLRYIKRRERKTSVEKEEKTKGEETP